MKCECPQAGYCPRYGKDVGRREHQICSGIDCNAGESAMYRQLWLQETQDHRRTAGHVPPGSSARKITLVNHQCPGDALVMTAAIRSLHVRHPGKFAVAVDTPFPDIFLNSPDVVPTHGGERVDMHYPAIHQANQRGIHFMQAFCEHLEEALGVQVPLAVNKPVLYGVGAGPNSSICKSAYWLVNAGTKNDLTCKRYGRLRYQEVVDSLRGTVKFVQVGREKDRHERLGGLFADLVGKTSLRELITLCYYAEGVLTPTSFLMHCAAALDRPCVVVAGGREPVQWNAYPKQHYMHTIGQLPCCADNACWKSRIEPIGDGTSHDQSLCELPVNNTMTGGAIPKCMELVRPEAVAQKIRALSLWSASCHQSKPPTRTPPSPSTAPG